MSTFFKADSKTLQAARKNCPKRVDSAPEDLKYYFIKYQCVHGGKRISKSTGKRNTGTLRQGCEAFIYLTLNNDSTSLVVSNISETHNHETSPALFNSLPNQRKLAPDVKKQVKGLLKLRANKKLIREKN